MKMTYSITQCGKPLDKSLYTIDEKTKTFSTNENGVGLSKPEAIAPFPQEAIAPSTQQAIAPSTQQAIAPFPQQAIAPFPHGEIA
jgi:hypothetical protein